MKKNEAVNPTCHGWVDVAQGVVSREAFVSDDVHKLELDKVFMRNWVFLAHESELPNTGDFVARTLADAPVIVIRDSDGSINALLNSCRHRGSTVSRGDAGNARRFVCPYHGWSYERNGQLITTTFDKHLPEDMDFSAWSLVKVPRLQVYNGLVFGSWNPDVEDLADYLGDFRWYIDLFLGRSPQGMQVLAPPHRWRTKAHWKVGALNFVGDSLHPMTTHIGPRMLDPVRLAAKGFATGAEHSIQIVADGGHGCTLTYLASGLPEASYKTHDADLQAFYQQKLAAEQYAALQHLRVAVGTIFPNLSFIETQVGPSQKAVVMRLWQPVSGTEMEILSWVLVEREASPEYKEHVLKAGSHNFGMAGVFDQDDMELWALATLASNNPVAQRYPYSFHAALPVLDKPIADYKGPCRAYQPIQSEIAQFEFMRHWERLMTATATSK
jgi:phenylpropionate dioxygenase-like ring-hydroxylating dioxygenase large terminal subunit